MIDELLERPPGCLIVLATGGAIPGGLLWCVNGLTKDDYSFSGGVWAGPLLSIAAVVFAF